jgi:hypothetical protein
MAALAQSTILSNRAQPFCYLTNRVYLEGGIDTFPYAIVLSTAIPIAIVSGFSRFKSFRLDFE